jgi:hypothetical protein
VQVRLDRDKSVSGDAKNSNHEQNPAQGLHATLRGSFDSIRKGLKRHILSAFLCLESEQMRQRALSIGGMRSGLPAR